MLVGDGHDSGDLLDVLDPGDDVGDVLERDSGLLGEGCEIVAVDDPVHGVDVDVLGSDGGLELLDDGGGDDTGQVLGLLDGCSEECVIDPPDEFAGSLVAVCAGAPDGGPSSELLCLVGGLGELALIDITRPMSIM